MLGPVIEDARVRREPPRVEHAPLVPRRPSLDRNGYRQGALARQDRDVEGHWQEPWAGEILREKWDAQQEKTQ